MASFRPGTPRQEEFLHDLLAAGHLIDSGVPGVYGRGDPFERVRLGFDARVTEASETESPEHMVFPPLLPSAPRTPVGMTKPLAIRPARKAGGS